MKIIAGLGNPGARYSGTRHNVGFEVVDELARRGGVRFSRSWRFSIRQARMRDGVEDVTLVKPQSFMNRSGQALAPFMRRKGLAPSDLVVILDDAELECGRIRIRPSGGNGGHNGLRSIIEHLGTEEFVRVRIGIGPRPSGHELVEYVLSRFDPDQRAGMNSVVACAADAALSVVSEGVDRAMNRFNNKIIER